MISIPLLLKCYEAASMPRWAEFARPVELDELGRQGQMLQVAFVLATSAPGETTVDWRRLLDLAWIRFFRRLALTDIQAPVFGRLYAEKRGELNAYALSEMEGLLSSLPGGFLGRFADYLRQEDADSLYAGERRVLDGASALVSQWEADLIAPLNTNSVWFPEVAEQVQMRMNGLMDGELADPMRALITDRIFLEATGRLRIQRRWSRMATVPAFNVAGHSFIVALLSWAACEEVAPQAHPAQPGHSGQRLANTAFGAAFHDIGEALTRDIVNPVKRGGRIEGLLREIELDALSERLWPHVPEGTAAYLRAFTGLEFEDGVVQDSPYDGGVIAACDKLAAAAEVRVTIDNGIAAPALREVQRDLKSAVAAGPIAKLIAELAEA